MRKSWWCSEQGADHSGPGCTLLGAEQYHPVHVNRCRHLQRNHVAWLSSYHASPRVMAYLERSAQQWMGNRWKCMVEEDFPSTTSSSSTHTIPSRHRAKSQCWIGHIGKAVFLSLLFGRVNLGVTLWFFSSFGILCLNLETTSIRFTYVEGQICWSFQPVLDCSISSPQLVFFLSFLPLWTVFQFT